jgi:hypothetical protein
MGTIMFGLAALAGILCAGVTAKVGVLWLARRLLVPIGSETREEVEEDQIGLSNLSACLVLALSAWSATLPLAATLKFLGIHAAAGAATEFAFVYGGGLGISLGILSLMVVGAASVSIARRLNEWFNQAIPPFEETPKQQRGFTDEDVTALFRQVQKEVEEGKWLLQSLHPEDKEKQAAIEEVFSRIQVVVSPQAAILHLPDQETSEHPPARGRQKEMG